MSVMWTVIFIPSQSSSFFPWVCCQQIDDFFSTVILYRYRPVGALQVPVFPPLCRSSSSASISCILSNTLQCILSILPHRYLKDRHGSDIHCTRACFAVRSLGALMSHFSLYFERSQYYCQCLLYIYLLCKMMIGCALLVASPSKPSRGVDRT